MSEDLGSLGTDGPRRWLRRLALSVLAGGGVTAATLGGPMTGSMGAEPRIVPPASSPEGEAETTTSSSSTTAVEGSTSASTTTSSTSSESASSSSSPSSSQTSSSTSTTRSRAKGSTGSNPSSEQGAQQERPAVTLLPGRGKGKGGARKPTRTGSSTGGKQGKGSTGSNPSSGSPATGPSNVAPPPQTVASRANLLSALTQGVAVSSQALDLFYQVPPFLLPIYQAAAVQYGVPWEVLAAINEVETDYGNDLSVSTAGAVGWMQFMPQTWLQYGVDALDAGYADPYNPVDAIFAAARYLAAAGASKNLRTAIFAYNHSEEYVESVLLRARLLASYPPSAIATLTGLIEGVPPLHHGHIVPGSVDPAAFTAPVGNGGSSSTANTTPAPTPTSAGQGAVAGAARTKKPSGVAKQPSTLPSPAQFVEVEGEAKGQVLATQAGRVVALGHSRALGNYLALEDVYGDVFSYAHLGSLATRYHVSSDSSGSAPTAATAAVKTAGTGAPKASATAGSQPPVTLKPKSSANQAAGGASEEASAPVGEEASTQATSSGKVLLYAHPENPDARAVVARLRASRVGSGHGWEPLRVGAVVSQGTILGAPTVAAPGAQSGTLKFAIRPAGDSSAVNPQPIMQNWSQLSRALHPEGAKGNSGLVGATADAVFLLSQSELERAVLADPGIQLPTCARHEVAGGHVNGRVLAMLLFLSRNGLKPTVSELRCNGQLPAKGGVYSAIDRGEGADISKINGVSIQENQGAGTITDLTIRTLLTLQGRFSAHRIISLMRYPGAPSTEAALDHASYIEVDFQPASGPVAPNASASAAHSAGPGSTAPSPLAASLGIRSVGLSAAQWSQLVERISALQQPKVPTKPGSFAIRDPGSSGSTGKHH